MTTSNRVYVTGHQNPDTDSIAAAVGYAELLNRVDPDTQHVPVRLGELSTQTRWVLERSGAPEPRLLSHINLRARDVMTHDFPRARHDEPVRQVGLTMAREDTDVVPVLDADGKLAGVVTERALAHRYIRESREASSLVDTPTAVGAIVDVLEGEVLHDAGREVAGRVWVLARALGSPTGVESGDVVVIGDRDDMQRSAVEHGVAMIVTSNGCPPEDATLQLAKDAGISVVVSPLDSYVTGRLITLAAPCTAVLEDDPLTVRPDDLLDDIAESVKDVHYRAAVAVDTSGKPVGLVSRSALVSPQRRRVILVDHAEPGQSVPGIEEAEIVEILDHHHIGSIETASPVRAIFDPVGSTATLVLERFQFHGMEPERSTAVLLLSAVLSDTVILNSPTTTERDHQVVRWLEGVLGLDAEEHGREMFEATTDISDIPAKDVVVRDAKHYDVDGRTLCIAQIEVVGDAALERKDELQEALDDVRERRGYVALALMVTDIVAKDSVLLVSGDAARVAKAFGKPNEDGTFSLPGVMSRKKQVAPKLLAAF